MRTETNRIEYKQQLPDSFEKEAVAFLNYSGGGVLYVGINKHGEVVDICDIDGDMLKIKDRLKNNVLPSCMGLFDVAVETIDGKDIIKITFASGPEKPYYIRQCGMSEKGCFIRVGTASEPMPVKMIEELFSRRTRNSIGKIKSYRQHLNFEQLKIYYESTGILLNDKFATNLELLTETGEYNYVAYLLSDTNNLSIKVAKYKGTDRNELIESNEYGYSCLIKSTKQVLDKIELENKTLVKITSKERKEHRLWNPIALREAIINALVHNDYSKEVPPKFEIFDNRIEITSAGAIPEGLAQDEFFNGFSVPRNKEIMRIFKDLDLVEHLGSGVPRILKSYGKECFQFSDNFIRMTFPAAVQVRAQVNAQDKNLLMYNTQIPSEINTKTDAQVDAQVRAQVRAQVGAQVGKLLFILDTDNYSIASIMKLLGLTHRQAFLRNYLHPALRLKLIEMTIPDKPNSRLQQYRLTSLGLMVKNYFENNSSMK